MPLLLWRTCSHVTYTPHNSTRSSPSCTLHVFYGGLVIDADTNPTSCVVHSSPADVFFAAALPPRPSPLVDASVPRRYYPTVALCPILYTSSPATLPPCHPSAPAVCPDNLPHHPTLSHSAPACFLQSKATMRRTGEEVLCWHGYCCRR